MKAEVGSEKIADLLKGLIEKIEISVNEGHNLPWNSPYFVGAFNAMVNAQEKKDHDNTPCPGGRPYTGIINNLFLMFGAEDARKRNGATKMDHRFVRRSSIITKDKKYKIHSDAVVKKGAKGIFVFFPLRFRKDNPDFNPSLPASKDNPKEIYFSSGRWSGGYVFNLADTNLVELGVFPALDPTTTKDNPSIETLERVICGYPQAYNEAECVPHYSLTTKEITTPGLQHAKSAVAHYSTRCHELVHQLQDMVGDLTGRADRESYSKHELEAEMGAAFVLSTLGFIDEDGDEIRNSQAYIRGWLSRLKDDPKMLFDAAVKATRFGNMILKGTLPAVIKDREKFTFLPAESEVEDELGTGTDD